MNMTTLPAAKNNGAATAAITANTDFIVDKDSATTTTDAAAIRADSSIAATRILMPPDRFCVSSPLDCLFFERGWWFSDGWRMDLKTENAQTISERRMSVEIVTGTAVTQPRGQTN